MVTDHIPIDSVQLCAIKVSIRSILLFVSNFLMTTCHLAPSAKFFCDMTFISLRSIGLTKWKGFTRVKSESKSDEITNKAILRHTYYYRL